LSVLSSVDQASELLGKLPQLGLEEGIESGARLAGEGLGEALLGHEAVLGDDVGHHVPLAAVAGRVLKQEGDKPPVDWLAPFRCLNNVVQEKVASLNLKDLF